MMQSRETYREWQCEYNTNNNLISDATMNNHLISGATIPLQGCNELYSYNEALRIDLTSQQRPCS